MADKLDPNSWEANAVHITKELNRLAEGMDSIFGELKKIHIEIAMLKVKSGIWGAIGGVIPVVAYVVLSYLKK